ncbi:Uncharacterized protein LOK49_LG04G01321 [Camellia lanceoleosa]|uniref:Uncharacterized protein n=1 Tax=Camellia lanceoleosa TaxID=1840588 RepID=A0ACC0I2K0_9ERIC|nr:Uncharacterized protein LOK49_LG04G01321 [Camellia lanceoleosa]
MTVGSATGNHGTSTEEQDALDRSKKRVKTTESMENLVSTLLSGCCSNSGGNCRPKWLHWRDCFDCEAAYLSSDEEMENEKDTEEAMVGEGNTLHPVVKLPVGLLKKIREPWKQCLIVRLADAKVGYNLFVNRMRKVWNLQANFETLDIGNGFFILKFKMMEDYTKVFTGGPWVVLDRYVTVRKWHPNFKSDEAEDSIWVRFPNLPIEYYDEKVLYHISKVLGTPLKIDINTAMAARGKYARVCVEMDLRKPLISHLTIGRYHYVVQYEHLHTLCFSCGRVGHRKDRCPEYPVMSSEKMKSNVTVNTPGLDSRPGSSRPTDNKNKEVCTKEEKSGYGPWTIAPSRRKFQQHKHKPKAQQYKGNRFEVLNSTTVHGESSGAQEHYTDLDLGHTIATNSISYGPKQGPLPTNVQSSPRMDVDQTQLVQNMGPVLGPATGMEIGHGPNEIGEKQQTMQSTIHNESLTISPDGNIIQTNPNSLTKLKSSPVVHTASGSAISAGDTPPVHRSKARGGKALSHSEAQEVKGHGRNRREHRDDRASRESVPDAAVYGAREKSLSPHRNRMVGRRSEAPDSTMVGDRFAQCETHGVSETREHYGDRSEECEKHPGAA